MMQRCSVSSCLRIVCFFPPECAENRPWHFVVQRGKSGYMWRQTRARRFLRGTTTLGGIGGTWYIQLRHLIPALNAWPARAWYTTACPIPTQFTGHGCDHIPDLTTERSFNSPATWIIDVLDLIFSKLSMRVCTTRHWQASGQLMQKIDICTVVPDSSRRKNAHQLLLCNIDYINLIDSWQGLDEDLWFANYTIMYKTVDREHFFGQLIILSLLYAS